MAQNGKPTFILSKPAVTTRLAGLQCHHWSQSPFKLYGCPRLAVARCFFTPDVGSSWAGMGKLGRESAHPSTLATPPGNLAKALKKQWWKSGFSWYSGFVHLGVPEKGHGLSIRGCAIPRIKAAHPPREE